MAESVPAPALILAALLGLGACANSSVSSDFQCSAQLGQPCATIAQSDGTSSHRSAIRHAPGGSLERGGARPQPSLSPTIVKGPQPLAYDSEEVSQTPQVVVAGDGLNGGQVVNPVLFREPERVTTVWIAPFVGENGYLYQPGFVHFVVEPGRWFGPTGSKGGS